MEIVSKRLSEIKPYKGNARKNDGAVPHVVDSIREYGFRVPILIDREGVIVCGHTRYKAAKKLKLEEVPCIVIDDLTPEQIQAYRIMDNKSGENSLWDEEKLLEEFRLIEFEGYDLEKTGFIQFEINGINGAVNGIDEVENTGFKRVAGDEYVGDEGGVNTVIVCETDGEKEAMRRLLGLDTLRRYVTFAELRRAAR